MLREPSSIVGRALSCLMVKAVARVFFPLVFVPLPIAEGSTPSTKDQEAQGRAVGASRGAWAFPASRAGP